MPGLSECLQGKVTVVTGAARGIGRASAIAFAREFLSPRPRSVCLGLSLEMSRRGGVPCVRRRAHGFGCNLRRHRRRQRPQHGVKA